MLQCPKGSLQRFVPAAAAAFMLLLLSGCKHEAPPSSSITPLPAAGGTGSGPANNPPPGQPNHMTPEMQAQIEHYKALAPKNGPTGSTH